MILTRLFPEPPDEGRSAPTLYHVFWFLIFIWVSALPVGYVANSLMQKFPDSRSWILLASYFIQFGVALWVGMRWWNIGSFVIQKVPIALYFILIPATLALSVIAEGLVSLIPMPESIAQMFAQMISYDLGGYLVIGIVAPILEELIFRGLILKGLLNRYPARFAIIWSALFFGVAHLNPWQFIAAFMIGLLIGWLYFKTQSIWPGIFIHWFNNSAGFMIGLYYNDMNVSLYEITGNRLLYGTIILACVFICWLSFLSIKRVLKVNRLFD